ncbi:MAG: TRAP-type C4-dicarboxylate transport system, substrate-binding protein [Deltaproteobacteria bacterium]|nr:TRAP-type C4-dicarboxylate transport system, substrate-binding protein [Deltaproteobacteria bacterium]
MKIPLKIGLVGICVWVCLLVIGPARAAEKSVIIKLATLAPEGSSWMKTFHALNKEVMEKTNNQVQFKMYGGGVLGDEDDVLRKMKIGQIQAAALSSGTLARLYKEFDVLQVPFLFQTYGEVDFVLTKMDSFFRKGLEDNGYVLLGWSEGGFSYLMSTTPIASVADLRRAKVWSWGGSPLTKAIFDEAKVTAIPLSIPDVLVGLQTGLVDVVYAPPTVAITLQWFTKVKCLTDVPLAYATGAVVMKRDVFKRLPPQVQNILLDSSQRLLNQSKEQTRNENQDAIKVMTKQGVRIVKPPKENVEEFKTLSNQAMRRIRGQAFSAKAIDEMVANVENYRKGLK